MNETRSYWLYGGAETDYPSLDRDVGADVAVLGAGITGVLTALLLRRQGLEVVMVDQSRAATGVTGYTTAKVSSLHGLTYARLRSRFGEDGARTYGEANEAGLARIAGLVDELGIDCAFRRRPNLSSYDAAAAFPVPPLSPAGAPRYPYSYNCREAPP